MGSYCIVLIACVPVVGRATMAGVSARAVRQPLCTIGVFDQEQLSDALGGTMGWRGALRSAAAADRRARTSEARRQRGVHREADRIERELTEIGATAFAQLDRDSERLTRKVANLEIALADDPIDALQLRFDEDSRRWISEPFTLDGDILKGVLTLTAETVDDSPLPPAYEDDSCRVQPIGLLLLRWATVIAFRVEGRELDYRIKLDWVKSRNRSDSRVYLLSSGDYYYPISSSLTGELVPGAPRTGLVAFEPFRRPSQAFEIHVSDVKMSKKRGDRKTFTFNFPAKDLDQSIAELLSKPPLRDEVASIIETTRENARREVEAKVSDNLAALDAHRTAVLSRSGNSSAAAVFIVVAAVVVGLLYLLLR